MSTMANRVPLCRPDVGGDEIAAIQAVFASGALSHGAQVGAFESAFAALVGASYGIAFNSWTSAAFLTCSYLRERFGPGEVIVPSYTFVASANTIAAAGLTPRFVDVEWATHETTAELIAPLITEKTRAIMPVHFAGRPCRMAPIMALAERHGLMVIEDSAECVGAAVDGRQAGGFGVGIFSFYSTKNITTGEGGMVTTSDEALAEWLRVRLAHGIKKGSYSRDGQTRGWYRNAVAVGQNFRLSNFQAAMGLVQLSRLNGMNARRYDVAHRYDEALRAVDGIECPELLPASEHSYQMYVIKAAAADRDRILTALQAAGVEASVHFDPPVHEQTAYSRDGIRLPVTERLARSSITLPISAVQTPDQTEAVVNAVRNAVGAVAVS
jgi:perosamine synthetase